MRWWKLVAVAMVVVGLAAWGLMAALAEPSAGPEAKKETTPPAKWAPAVESKPLSAQVQKGLDFLVKSQLKNGAWGQGEESAQMGQGLQLKDTPSAADTCICTLALIRAGSTPKAGPHAAQIRKAIEFLCAEIEESDSPSLFITKTRGTRVQGKLGQYVDTFMAAQVLAEVRDQMPDADSRKRLMAALDKVMDKIEKNQKSDGTWASDGWAPTLSQAMGVKALNKAAQAGVRVSEEVRARTEAYATKQFDGKSGKFASEGSAGVQLYSGASSLGSLQDSANTNDAKRAGLKEKAANAPTAPERQAAKDLLDRFDRNDQALKTAQTAIVEKLNDDKFVSGFGSNGGEEFLSYMNIGESLVVKGGDEWKKWDEKVTANLNRIQNEDGSWSGHHCITGRTFCTAAALLVLTVDRAPVPVAAKIKKQ